MLKLRRCPGNMEHDSRVASLAERNRQLLRNLRTAGSTGAASKTTSIPPSRHVGVSTAVNSSSRSLSSSQQAAAATSSGYNPRRAGGRRVVPAQTSLSKATARMAPTHHSPSPSVTVKTAYFTHNSLKLPPWQHATKEKSLDASADGLDLGCRCAACRSLTRQHQEACVSV